MSEVEHREQLVFEGQPLTLIYVEQMAVAPGVICDVYRFKERDDCDLGIIYLDPGYATPAQLIKKGDRTIEGHILGDCRLKVKTEERTDTYQFVGDEHQNVTVPVGSIMQWQNDSSERVVLYEICFPPYEDGRYENLPEGTKL